MPDVEFATFVAWLSQAGRASLSPTEVAYCALDLYRCASELARLDQDQEIAASSREYWSRLWLRRAQGIADNLGLRLVRGSLAPYAARYRDSIFPPHNAPLYVGDNTDRVMIVPCDLTYGEVGNARD